jgi:peptidoglycan/LPS O-acetylase OafA/YrhL
MLALWTVARAIWYVTISVPVYQGLSALETADKSRRMDVSAPAQKSGTLHLNHVEGMRALAAYAVYINHAYAQSNFPPIWPFQYSLVWGHLSVTVFIVLSGFCLTLPVVGNGDRLRGGAREFFVRRARRILPPYYAAMAAALILIWTVIGKPTGTLWDVPIQLNKVAIVSHFLLLQDLFGTGRINYAFWSIAVEWQIYLLFPALVWCWRTYGPRIAVPLALLVGYALRLGFADTRVERAATHYLGMFAFGMLAAYLVRSSKAEYRSVRDRVPWASLAAGSVAVVWASMWRWGWEVSIHRFAFLDLFVGVAAMSVLVLTSREKASVVARFLSLKPLVFIGTFSYSVYLLHAPLLQLLWQYVFHPAGLGASAMFAALMGPGALMVLGTSYGFFYCFERPFVAGSARGAPRVDRETPRLVTP